MGMPAGWRMDRPERELAGFVPIRRTEVAERGAAGTRVAGLGFRSAGSTFVRSLGDLLAISLELEPSIAPKHRPVSASGRLPPMSDTSPRADGARVLADLHALRGIGTYKTGVHKPTFSEAHMQSLQWLAARLPE